MPPGKPHGDLSRWANQGVFLLNAILTVQQGKSNSHQKKGWESFTTSVIKTINRDCDNVVFMLWGKKAHDTAKVVNKDRHLILANVHPSPLAGQGFKTIKDFSIANAYL
jgi:uracil-DNA glycosylase